MACVRMPEEGTIQCGGKCPSSENMVINMHDKKSERR
jgi:hypothetical protein